MRVIRHPRYVDMDKCIACGTCAEKCPKKVDDVYNEGLIKRKAIYVPYSQAVPSNTLSTGTIASISKRESAGHAKNSARQGPSILMKRKRKSP